MTDRQRELLTNLNIVYIATCYDDTLSEEEHKEMSKAWSLLKNYTLEHPDI